MVEFLLPVGLVSAEVFVVCHNLLEMRGDSVQDNFNNIIVCHLGIDIESINIIHVFLDSTCLFEIMELVENLLWLVVVTIVFPNSMLHLFPSINSILVSLLLLLCISSCT